MNRCAAVALALLLALPAAAQTPPIDPVVLQLINERDRQYAQRFEAQEKGTAIALAAQEKGTALALTSIKEFTTAAFVAAKEAVDKAQVASEKRFDSVNEFRNTLKDQQARFVDKSEVDIRFRAMTDRLDIVAARLDQNTGRSAGIDWAIGLLTGIVGLALGIFGAFLAFRRAPPAAIPPGYVLTPTPTAPR